MFTVPVPEETRHQLSLWCSAQVPAAERGQRQIGYTIHGDDVTIVDRRAPTYPELQPAGPPPRGAGGGWGAPVGGGWSLSRPDSDAGWQGGPPGATPRALLDQDREGGCRAGQPAVI